MTALNSAKEEVAGVLTAAGIKAYAHDTKVQTHSFVVVEPGSPYVEAGETFGTNLVRYDLAVIGKPITVNDCWESLDDFVDEVVLALWDTVDVESISQPGVLTLGNKTLVACTVTVTATLNFKEAI